MIPLQLADGPAKTVTVETVTAKTVTVETVTAETVTAETVTAETVTAETVTTNDAGTANLINKGSAQACGRKQMQPCLIYSKQSVG